jgi:hypothetical protein
MLFRETVDVYCENHMEHTNTLCGQRERESEREKVGGSERHYIWGGGQETISPVLKVPKQCPLVLLI